MNIHTMHSNDLEDLVPLHQQAFAGSLGVALGERYLRAFLNWFIVNPDTVKLVCRHEEQFAGYVFGGPEGYATTMNRDLVFDIALAVITHPWLVAKPNFIMQIPGRARSLLGRAANRKGGADDSAGGLGIPTRFRLVGIGVHPEKRRLGVGSVLISAFEEYVWRANYQEIQLSVYKDNLAAQMLYTRHGWRPLSDKGNVLTYSILKPQNDITRNHE